jgi:hypothetical protein
MDDVKAVNLGQVMTTIKSSGRPNTVLWQAPDSIAFVARGRELRSEFHSDPSDEVMYMIKGDMNLHYRTPDGDEKIAVASAPGRPASEYGRLCHGDGAQGRGDRCRRVPVLYAPAPPGALLPGFYRRTASNVLQPEPRAMAPTARFFCAAL